MLKLIAGLRLSSEESFVFSLAGYFFVVVAVIMLGMLLMLIVQTVLSIKRPYTRKGTNRRKIVGILWLVLIAGIISSFGSAAYSYGERRRERRNNAIAFVEQYDSPVLMSRDADAKLSFESILYPQIRLTFPNGHYVDQAPISENGKAFFNPEAGFCDYKSLSIEERSRISDQEPCTMLYTINNIPIYKSRRGNYYGKYKDIALMLGAKSSAESAIEPIISSLYETNKYELKQYVESSKYENEYSAAINSWHRTHRPETRR